MCPLDCPDSCSLDGSPGRTRAAIDGSSLNPVTAGYICAKVRDSRTPVRPDRLLSPAIRKGPKALPASSGIVGRALSVVAERMLEARRKWGGESILPYSYGGSNGLLTQDTSDATLFRRLGASRLARTVCAAATGAANMAMYGKMPSITYQDFSDARLIILWGVNPSASGIHLVPYIREAQRRGAKLIVVDPRRTPLARQADIHRRATGTDRLLRVVHRFLFEEGPRRGFLKEHASARRVAESHRDLRACLGGRTCRWNAAPHRGAIRPRGLH